MRHVLSIGTIIMIFVAAVVVIAFATGCATHTPLKTEASTSGIRAAEEAGAAKVPQASLHLQLAREELELAKKLASKDEKEKAKSMLSRAEADAELAVLLSREDEEKFKAREAVERARQLQEENN